MVILRGPFFSLEARGTIADCITYQYIHDLSIGKANRFRQYRASDAQIEVRNNMVWAGNIWANFHQQKRDYWAKYKDWLNLTSRKSYMSYFLKRTYLALWQFELPPDIGFCVTGNHQVGEFLTGGAFMTAP